MDLLYTIMQAVDFSLLTEALWQLNRSLHQLWASPSSRLYWPLLLSPLVLILLVTGWRYGFNASWLQIKQYLHPRHIWHRGSAVDMSWFGLNTLLKTVAIVPLLGSKLSVAMVVSFTLQQQFGDGPWAGLLKQHDTLSVWVLAGFSVAFFVVEDLSRFSVHVAMHKLPWLWACHQVHHSASQLSPLTIHRIHPVEMALAYTRAMLVFGLMAGLYTWLFQAPSAVWQWLGVDLLGLLFNSFGANLRHSPVYLSFGRLEHWFISPAQHQLHHSSASAHHDKNFGTCLAIWDKLYGSWLSANTGYRQSLQFGLADATHTVNKA